MRIIAGTAKGRIIKAPKTGLRPLSDQAREALFNILAPVVGDSVFLDLFAGSGAVGLEALSRGARMAFFVENQRKMVEAIRNNLEVLSFSDRAEIFSLDVLSALKIFQKKDAKFDIIFLGAPYGSPDLLRALELIGGAKVLSFNNVVIAEHRAKTELDPKIGSLEKVRVERYGDTVFSFYKGAA